MGYDGVSPGGCVGGGTEEWTQPERNRADVPEVVMPKLRLIPKLKLKEELELLASR